jgi:endoglucanase
MLTMLLAFSLLSLSGLHAAANYNYTDAFAKSILFYEANWCGPDAGNNRLKWRGPCHVNDGSDVGLDLTGGFHDCGDHVKFGLPQTYAASTLAWAYYEYKDVFAAKGQDGYILNIVKHFTDYFMKCFANDTTFYYQIGNGDTDHSYWGPPEMQPTARPAYYVANPSTPGSDVAGNAAATLALMSVNYKDIDAAYADKCLTAAKKLYAFGKTYRGNSKGQTYYTPQSYYDEMMWGAIWLSVATGDQTYLNDVETYMTEKGIGGDKVEYYNHWTHCWDDVYGGVALKMAQLTGKAKWIETVEENLTYWRTQLTTTPGGMKYLHEWAPLKYSSTASFLALVYNKTTPRQEYVDFAKGQIDYILGSNPKNLSYLVGFGANYPKFPHHRAASGRLEGAPANETKKDPERHILYGALVGGPKVDDSYADDIDQYVYTEVGLDYNAGLVGALAGMVSLYGAGQTPEATPDAAAQPAVYSAQAQVTYENNQQTVINAYVFNTNTSPPHFETDLSMRFFVDLSEFYAHGFTVQNVSTNIDYTGNGARISSLQPWDEINHIYYAEISWQGIQLFGKCQVQFKVYTQSATVWDGSNDFSRTGLGSVGGALVTTQNIPVYKNGVLVYGKEPVRGPTPSPTPVGMTPVPTVTPKAVTVYYKCIDSSATANQMRPYFQVSNTSGAALNLANVKIRYYYTADGTQAQTFACDWAQIGSSNVTGTLVKMAAATSTADYYLELGFTSGAGSLAAGASTGEIQCRINKTDWANYTLTNDYSYNATMTAYGQNSNVTGYVSGVLIVGNEPGTGNPTPTPVRTATPNPTVTPVITATPVITGTPTPVRTATPVRTVTPRRTATPRQTATPRVVTPTPEVTATPVRTATPAVTATPVPTTGSIRVQFYNQNTAATTNQIYPNIRVVNTGTGAMALSNVKIRYYYTIDGVKTQTFYCDYSSVGTSNVTGTFVTMATAKTGADTYLEVGFASGAGSLAAGGSVTIQSRFAKSDWTNYTQTNDYSFNSSGTTYADWLKVTAYVSGSLQWGTEP